MNISIASGKGGTGKTTIATNLAKVLALNGKNVTLLDCDVEAPDCRLFIKPQIETETPVCLPVPEVNPNLCNQCGKCGTICEFHAIGLYGKTVLVFPELCHACGGCVRVCPTQAIQEMMHRVGTIFAGQNDSLFFKEGLLKIGEAKAPPIIHAVKKNLDLERVNIIDSPPGTSCSVVAAVKNSDYVILVTEPTPFGLHDLRLAVGVVRKLGIQTGVVINRSTIGDHRVNEFCQKENIQILMEIPENRQIAEACSSGKFIYDLSPELKSQFELLYEKIKQAVDK